MKPKKVNGKNKDNQDAGRGVGFTSSDGSINGTERPRKIIQKDRPRRNSTRTDAVAKCTESSNGKILERLKIVENAFYSYVHAHQDRLEARLVESKLLEATFFEQVDSLRQEILAMAEENEEEENEEDGGEEEK